MTDIVFPLRVRLATGGNSPAIVDNTNRVIAIPPINANVWTWQDRDAKDLVEYANLAHAERW